MIQLNFGNQIISSTYETAGLHYIKSHGAILVLYHATFHISVIQTLVTQDILCPIQEGQNLPL